MKITAHFTRNLGHKGKYYGYPDANAARKSSTRLTAFISRENAAQKKAASIITRPCLAPCATTEPEIYQE